MSEVNFPDDQSAGVSVQAAPKSAGVSVQAAPNTSSFLRITVLERQLANESKVHSETVAELRGRLDTMQASLSEVCCAKLQLESSAKESNLQMESSAKESNLQMAAIQAQFDSLTSENSSLKIDLKNARYQTSVSKNRVFRLSGQVKNLNAKLVSLHLDQKISLSSLGTANNVRHSATFERSSLKRKLQNSLVSINKFKAEVVSLKSDVLVLTAELEAARSRDQLVTRSHGRQFSDRVRMTVVGLQGKCNVAASRCSQVIKCVARELFDVQLQGKDLPSVTTAVNIADEGHVLAKCQAAEKMVGDSYTFHTDETSRDQQKLMGQQITLRTGETLNLGFLSVARENASTLLEVTVSTLKELADLYAVVDERQDIFSKVIENLSCLMTDRAAVNKKFGSDLQQYRKEVTGTEEGVHFLFCNAHFLIGLSNSCDQALKEIESSLRETTGRLGRDIDASFVKFGWQDATSRAIRLSCDLLGPRGDQKSGCRQEWLCYCEEHSIRSKIPSFRSNRFNCYFEGAAAIIHHRQDILSLLDSSLLSHSNLKTRSVALDCKDDKLMSLVCSVAVLYLYITGPYWQLLNSKEVNYTDFHVYVQRMLKNLYSLSLDAGPLLTATYDGVFDGEFFTVSSSYKYHASVTSFLSISPHVDVIKSTLETVLKKFVEVTERQLDDFIGEGKFARPPTEDVSSELRHCPLTNLLGENAFGDLDFTLSKMRHSSLHHHTTVHMLKHNNTAEWLGSKPANKQKRLMQLGRGKAKELRRLHKRQEALVRLQLRQQMAENERLAKEKEMKAAEQRKKVFADMLACGGPCSSAPEVMQLSRNQLAVHIRYFKLCDAPGAKDLRLQGKKEKLAMSIISHQGLPDEPSTKRRKLSSSESSSDSDSSTDTEIDVSPSPPFSFSAQGKWVAVYYDNTYYVGQVLEVKNSTLAVVKFLITARGDPTYFKWPEVEDISEVKALYVFFWDFEVLPYSNDSRIWVVPEVKKIETSYKQILSTNEEMFS